MNRAAACALMIILPCQALAQAPAVKPADPTPRGELALPAVRGEAGSIEVIVPPIAVAEPVGPVGARWGGCIDEAGSWGRTQLDDVCTRIAD